MSDGSPSLANDRGGSVPLGLYYDIVKAAGKGLRIGQLLDNIFFELREEGIDPFYMEDSELVRYVHRYVERLNG